MCAFIHFKIKLCKSLEKDDKKCPFLYTKLN